MIRVLFTDTHFGTHSNSAPWLNSQIDFIYKQLIPHLKQLRQKDSDIRLIHLGDVFDSRSTLSTLVATQVVKAFKDLRECVSKFVIIGGNHDYYSPDTDEIDSLNLVLRDASIELYTTEIGIDGEDLYVPWYKWIEQDELKSLVASGKYGSIFTHTDIIHEKIDPIFANTRIYSGHVHIPDLRPFRFNLGSCYALDFADHDAQRGYYIVEDDNKMSFVPNQHCIRFWRLYNEDLLDEQKMASISSRDYVEVYVKQTNLVNEEYLEKIDQINKSVKNRLVIPQIESTQINEEFESIDSYDITSICRKAVPEDLRDKFEQIIGSLSE